MIWTDPNTVVAGGHTLSPIMFRVVPVPAGGGGGDGGIKLEVVGKLDVSGDVKKESNSMTAMRRFQSLDRHAKVLNDEVRF